jgi:hypothetical protein
MKLLAPILLSGAGGVLVSAAITMGPTWLGCIIGGLGGWLILKAGVLIERNFE